MNINQERVWKVAGLVGIVLAVYLVALAIGQFKAIGYIGKSDQTVNTITVSGTGDAVAVPDIATFSFTDTETAKTVADAQAQATAKTNAAIKLMKDSGVADKDIKTTSYNINPHYEYSSGICTQYSCPPSKSTLTGYDVSQTIEVKVRDLSKAGALLTSVGTAGVQNVNGLNFSVDEPDSVQAKARSAAIDNAKAKADVLARELGVSLVRVVSFTEDNGSYPRPIMYAMDSKAVGAGVTAAAAPEVSPGEQKVTSNVSITYEIK